jgi:stage IV sporulation protein FB
MDSRDNPVYWSISCGNWFMTHVRVSLFVPVIVLAICWRLGLPNLRVALAFGGILVVSLLIHEFSHILAVRWTGGIGNEILIWPLGGLAFVQPAGTFRSQFLTPAAGPLSNLLLCTLVLAPVWRDGALPHLLNPFLFPLDSLHQIWARDLFVLIFWCNWVLLLANILPVFPLDGIRMVLAILKSRTDVESAAEMAIRISFIVAGFVMLVGLGLDGSWIVFFGAVVFILSLLEWIQMRTAETLDDSFMGYDFSQGYTSLERSTRQNQPPVRRRPGLIESWRERRRAARELRARLEEEQVQQQLDAILEKVHQHGIGSLSDAERRQLNRASSRLRDRGKQAE